MGAPVSSSDDSFANSLVDRSMAGAETLLYAAVGILLVVSAVVAVGTIGYDLVRDIDDGALAAVEASLDGLLLVFILIELLGAVRATVSEPRASGSSTRATTYLTIRLTAAPPRARHAVRRRRPRPPAPAR